MNLIPPFDFQNVVVAPWTTGLNTWGWVMLMGFVGPPASRVARLAALDGLVGKAATGRQAELATIVAPMLADPDAEIRLAVARALAALKVPETVPLLEERRGVEGDARVRAAIDAALAAIRGSGG